MRHKAHNLIGNSTYEVFRLPQMSRIADDTLLNDSLSEAELAGSAMTINGMKLLKFVGDTGGIDLTKSGFFNRKCVVWAAEEFQWPEYEPSELYRMNKVLNEQDFPPLSVMHNLMVLGQLMRQRKGKATLIPAGKSMLGHFGKLQALLFETYFTRYHFGNDERFSSFIEHNDYRHFFGVVAIHLGDWTTLSDFAHWCLPVPLIPSTRGRPEFEACLHMRANLVRPLNWLGLIEEADASHLMPIEQRRIRKTALFDKFLHFGSHKSPAVYH
jgi:hypothetical protein